MDKKFELLPPIMPNFIKVNIGQVIMRDETNSINVSDLSSDEAEAYGELMKQTFIKHWGEKKEKKKVGE